MNTIDRLRVQVAKACNDEADFDEVMQAVDVCINANPLEPEYLRLRIALFDAAYDRVSAWKDRCTLHGLQPEDMTNHLALLVRQRQSAFWIANDVYEEKIDALSSDDETPENSEQEAALASVQKEMDAYSEDLENNALEAFLQLMKSHASNTDAAHQILAAWNEANIWSPWRHLTMILQALAAHPQDLQIKKTYATFLISLCDAVAEETDKTPTGYFEHIIAGRFHAVTVYQAIAALDSLLSEGALGDEPDLLRRYADLLKTLDDYLAAARCLRLAAQAYQNGLATAREDERENLQINLDDVLHQASICDAGRTAVHTAHFSELNTSMAGLDRIPAFAGADRAATVELTQQLDTLKSTLTEWQTATMQDPQVPDAVQKEELSAHATKVANSIINLIRWDRIHLQQMQISDFGDDINPWFDEVLVELRQTDMQLLCWFQNLGNVAALGCEAPGQCWLSTTRDFALTIEATSKIRLKRCLSRFSDGTLMLTADSRGGNYFVSGPQVHIFSVYQITSLTEMLTLHKARVDAHLAATPDVTVTAIDSLEGMQELENILRDHSREFRLSQGITDVEIRGMNVKFHDYFSAQLKRVVAERIATLES